MLMIEGGYWGGDFDRISLYFDIMVDMRLTGQQAVKQLSSRAKYFEGMTSSTPLTNKGFHIFPDIKIDTY